MWHKDLEVASQGCFSVRNYHEEHKTYEINKIPIVKMYSAITEVRSVIQNILNLSKDEIFSIQLESVNFIKQQNYWEKTVKILLGTLNG
jgi:hypothetical protein